jgi:hypothetical protein
MSEDKGKLSDKNSQDNLMPSFGGIVYGLTPIWGGVGAVAAAHGIGVARISGVVPVDSISTVVSAAYFEESTQIPEIKNFELQEESKYSAELDEILTQLHEADDRIAETRQNTVQLGIETRSMLDDLRKQLG